MTDIIKFLAEELSTIWETMAEMERDALPGRRATLRECADTIRILANREPPSCPRAERLHSPLRYCPDCMAEDNCELKSFDLRKTVGGDQ